MTETQTRNSVHELKTLPEYFVEVVENRKPFEVRFNDRDFRVGDILVLREWIQAAYTGRSCTRRVTYVLHHFHGLQEGWVALGLGDDANPWYAAVTDACVTSCIGWEENNARRSLMGLLAWETQVALDPEVSEPARKLMGVGAEAWELLALMKRHALGIHPEKESGSWHVVRYDNDGEELPLATHTTPAKALRAAKEVIDVLEQEPF